MLPAARRAKLFVTHALLILSGSGLLADDAAIDWDNAREFWSFKAPQAAVAPEVRNRAWPLTKTDRFILAALEERGLKPSESASDQQLLRRIFFDLAGMPPSPEE